jgi:hypothetical protein
VITNVDQMTASLVCTPDGRLGPEPPGTRILATPDRIGADR